MTLLLIEQASAPARRSSKETNQQEMGKEIVKAIKDQKSRSRTSKQEESRLLHGWKLQTKPRLNNGLVDITAFSPGGKRFYSIITIENELGTVGTGTLPSPSATPAAEVYGSKPPMTAKPLTLKVKLIADSEPVKFYLARGSVKEPRSCLLGVPTDAQSPNVLTFTLEAGAGEMVEDLYISLLTRADVECLSLKFSVGVTLNCTTAQALPKDVIKMPELEADNSAHLLLQATTPEGKLGAPPHPPPPSPPPASPCTSCSLHVCTISVSHSHMTKMCLAPPKVIGKLQLKAKMLTTDLRWLLEPIVDCNVETGEAGASVGPSPVPVVAVGDEVAQCFAFKVADKHGNGRVPTPEEQRGVTIALGW